MEHTPSEIMQAPFEYSEDKTEPKDGKISVHLKTLFIVAASVVCFFGALALLLGGQLFTTLNGLSAQAAGGTVSAAGFFRYLDAEEVREAELMFTVFLVVAVALPMLCALCFYRTLQRLSQSFAEFEKDGHISLAGAHSCIRELRDIEALPMELAERLRSAADQYDRLLILNDELKEMNLRDSLTQVFNRRAFEELNREMSPAPSGYVLYMVDIDRFKAINDEYGHLFGDEILRQTAHKLCTALSIPARIFRYGGDEFCVVVSSMQPEEVAPVAHQLCESVRTIDCKGTNLTISVGASSVSGIRQGRKSFKELLAQADHALYIAKDGGRDGHEVFSSFDVA